MTPATYHQIRRTCAVAIAAAVSLTGATLMSLEPAQAESAKDVVLEGRAAKTDRLDISNVKPEDHARAEVRTASGRLDRKVGP